MEVTRKVLKNGLRVLVAPIENMESATVIVWVKTGSRNEVDKLAGISHFLEHMVFKGSKKRPSPKAISEATDSLGAEINAATSKEWTNFYLKARAGVLEEVFDILSDMVLAPILNEQAIERERGVILEEIAMYEDMPMYDIGDVFENLIYKGSDIGSSVIGLPKTVKSIQKADFSNYLKEHYSPKNMLIAVAGGVDLEKTLTLAEKYFGVFDSDYQTDSKKADFKQGKSAFLLKSKKTDQAHVLLGFRSKEMGHKDRYIEQVLATILGRGMSSRLFTEIREKRGLAYTVRTAIDHYTDNGYFGTYMGVQTAKAYEAIKVVLEEHYKVIKESEIKDKELKKAKEFIKGNFALSLENTKTVARFFGEEELLLNKTRTPDEVFEAIDKVTIAEVQRVAKESFQPSNLNIAVIGPYNDAGKFEKIIF